MKNKMGTHPAVFLELLVNMATVGVAILLNALIDAAQISITSQDAHHYKSVVY